MTRYAPIRSAPSTNRTPVIRARALSKFYREGATELRALSGVHLDIPAGQLTLLMGPSGSGKTTLLSILGCILRPTEGRLELLGEDVTSLPEKMPAAAPKNCFLGSAFTIAKMPSPPISAADKSNASPLPALLLEIHQSFSLTSPLPRSIPPVAARSSNSSSAWLINTVAPSSRLLTIRGSFHTAIVFCISKMVI
jgi:energy-coupling factor transporter ATP-binding protein EcfA2